MIGLGGGWFPEGIGFHFGERILHGEGGGGGRFVVAGWTAEGSTSS